MAGETHQDQDQERFEDYLELERYIEELQAGRVAHPPNELTPSQASIYRLAALFRSTQPEAAEPSPEFAIQLQARLEQELQQPTKAKSPALSPEHTPKAPRKRLNISRRALLAGSAAVAASLAVGAGVATEIEKIGQNGAAATQPPTYNQKLVQDGTWLAVTTLAALGDNAVRFATDAIVGYVIRNDGDGDENEPVIAVSAACTHMGCIVQWQDSDRKFHCPCHGGLFSEYGQTDTASSPIRYLSPLPRLETKVEGNNVFVKVPAYNNKT